MMWFGYSVGHALSKFFQPIVLRKRYHYEAQPKGTLFGLAEVGKDSKLAVALVVKSGLYVHFEESKKTMALQYEH